MNYENDEAFTGEIRAFGFNFAPRLWLPCLGQELKISQHQSLFSVIGHRFGGSGNISFKLPDLRGRAAMGAGVSTAQTSVRAVGQMPGEAAVVLSAAQLAAHGHAVNVIDAKSNTADPAGAFWAQGLDAGSNAQPINTYSPVANTTFAGGVVKPRGADVPQGHENRQPCLVTQFCICMQGVHPLQA